MRKRKSPGKTKRVGRSVLIHPEEWDNRRVGLQG